MENDSLTYKKSKCCLLVYLKGKNFTRKMWDLQSDKSKFI